MILKKPYQSIEDTLRHIRLQVAEGLEYANNNVPLFYTPIDLFYWLKMRTTYIDDPKGIELIQSLPTLLENNFHNVSGGGDCDCTSTAMLTCLQKQKFGKHSWIKLAGRNKLYPVHIWAGVDYREKELSLDLTNKMPNIERKYPYVQKIYFKPIK
jgi:hypothetical protein